MMKPSALIISLSLLCSIWAKTMHEDSQPLISYADGSNNVFVISQNTTGQKFIEYRPIKPAMSSSGSYDGGNAVFKKLSDKDFKSIHAACKKAEAARETHSKQRMMMSSSVSLYENRAKSVFIIKPRAASITEIEGLLKGAIK